MYIEGRYWNHYIGDTDDSLTLAAYLADKGKKEISLAEIFSDIGLDKLKGDFHGSDEPLEVALTKGDSSDQEEVYAEFYYGISVLADLAALLLECRVNGCVDLRELAGDDLEEEVSHICITATPEEHSLINKVLGDFVSDPLSYDLSDMCPEEDMMEMAEVCGRLSEELYG